MSESEVLQQEYLHAMGIETWQRRARSVGALPATSLEAETEARAEPAISGRAQAPGAGESEISIQLDHETASMDWVALQKAVSGCERCALYTTRSQTVFGGGDQQASLMIIGDFPDVDSEQQGEPFMGRSGQLLNEMLRAIGFKREQVYLSNLLKCRPSSNRDSQRGAMDSCAPYLQRQVALLQPSVVLAMGELTAQQLLKREEKLDLLRNGEHCFPGTAIPLIFSYHPAHLLSVTADKRKAWQDLQLTLRRLKQPTGAVL